MDATMEINLGYSIAVVRKLCFRANGGSWHSSLSEVVERAYRYTTFSDCLNHLGITSKVDVHIEVVAGWWLVHRYHSQYADIEPTAGPYVSKMEAVKALADLLRQGEAT